jgi:hypothetical protein
MGIYEEEKVWEKHWDKSIENLLNEYQKAFRRILYSLYELSGEELTKLNKKKERELLLFIASSISELQEFTEEWIAAEITTAFAVGQAAQMVTTNEAKTIKEGMKQIKKSVYAKKVLDSVLQDTFDDLLYATQHTENRTKRMVRDVFSQVMKQQTMENQGLRTMEKEIKKVLEKKVIEDRLKKEGLVAIVDASGKKWKTNVYLEMAVRTKIQESFRQGTISAAVEKGHDIAYVSSHNTDCEKCKKYEGLIISLTGKTEGFPTLDSIRSSENHQLFHPRCRHKIRSVRTYELIPNDVKEKNEKAKKNVEDLL